MNEEKKELKIEDLKKSMKIVNIIIALFTFILVNFFILVSIGIGYNEIILTIIAYILFIPTPFLFIDGIERYAKLEKELKKLGVPTEDDEMIEWIRKRMRELNE